MQKKTLRLLTITLAALALAGAAAAQLPPAPDAADQLRLRLLRLEATRPADRPTSETSDSSDVSDSSAPPAKPAADPRFVFVGVVGDQRMTKFELDDRVDRLMKRSAYRPGTESFNDERLIVEGGVLREWMERSILSQEATKRGLAVSDQEVEDMIVQLKAQPDAVPNVDQALSDLGFTPERLRAEIRDTMLVDELVKIEKEKYNNDDHLRQAYEKAPHLYRTPAQVHAIMFTAAIAPYETPDNIKKLRAKIEDVPRRMEKGERPEAIAESLGGVKEGMLGIDLDWIVPDVLTLPMDAQVALQKLKNGETSKIVMSKDTDNLPQAFHVIKIVGERPATGQTYQEAKPILQERLYDSIRVWLIDQLSRSGEYRVILSTSGIRPEILEPKAPHAPRQAPAAASSAAP